MMIPSATDPHAQDLARGTSPPGLEVETPATSVSTIVLGSAQAAEPLIRCTAPRADEAYLRARVVDATATSDAEGQRRAATNLARLLAGRGTDLDMAVTLAQHALSLGEDLELRQELVGWLAGLGEPARAALLLEPLREAASPERASAMLIQAAVLLSRGGKAQAAIDALEQAALLDPQDAAALELLGALAAAAPEVLSPAVAADRYLEAATRRQEAGDASTASENRLRAFEADPSHRGAASALAARLDGSARDDVLRMHARALEATEPTQARAIHKERMLAALSAGDHPRAIGACLDAELEGDVEDALAEKVDELLASVGLYELLALRLRLRAARVESTARSAIEATLGRLYEGLLASSERAVEAWIDAAVSDSSHEAALTWLRDHAERAHDYGPLVEALTRCASSDEVSEARVAALRELGALAEDKLGDAALASYAFGRLLLIGVDVEESKGTIRRLAPRVRRQDEALSVAKRALAGIEAPEGRVEALTRLAALLAGHPGLVGDYIAVLAELVDRLPAERSHVTALARLARRAQGGGDAASALDRVLRARLASSPSRVELVRTRLALTELALRRGDERAALAEVAPLLVEAPGHRGAASAALVLAASSRCSAERAQALVQASGPLPPALRSVLLTLAAELELGLGQADRASECARLAVEADGDSIRALAAACSAGALPRERAVAVALERAMALSIPSALLSRELADILEPLGEGDLALAWTERWVALGPDSTSAASEMLRRAVLVADASRIAGALDWVLAQPRLAVELVAPMSDALLALLVLDRGSAIALALRALDVFGPQVAVLCERLVDLADRSDEPVLAIAVLERRLAVETIEAAQEGILSDLLARRQRAGDFNGSARILARLAGRAAEPNEVLAALEATTAAAQQAGHAMSSDALISLAEARFVAVGRLPADQAKLRLTQASRALGALLWDLAGDERGAEQVLFAATPLLDTKQVERYARDLAELIGPEAAVDAVARRAEALPDTVGSKERAGLLIAAAGLAHAHGLHARALAVAVSAIEQCPARADALALVEQSAHVDGGLELLDGTYHRLADAALGRYGKRAAHYRAARQLDRRGAQELALRHATASFEAVPGEGATYSLLVRLAERATDPAEVAHALERVARASPVDEQPMWLKRAAALSGGSEEGARLRLDLLLRSLSIRPCPVTTYEVASAMRELAAFSGDRSVVALRFERAITSSLERLDGPEGARTAIAMAVVASEFDLNEPVLAALERAAVADGDVDEYVALLGHIPTLARCHDGAVAFVRRIQAEIDRPYSSVGLALLRLTCGLAEALGDEDARAALLAKAAAHDPEDTPLTQPIGERETEPLEPLEAADRADASRTEGAAPESSVDSLEVLEQDARERRDHAAIAAIVARRIALASSEDVRRVLRLRRAALLEQRLGRLEDACLELEAILITSPNDKSALGYLADLQERLGVPLKAAALLARMVELSERSEERADLGLRAARNYLLAGELDRASATIDKLVVVATSSMDNDVLELRAELARRLDDAPALSKALGRLGASSQGSTEHRAAIHLEGAHVALTIGDEPLALARARSAVELAPKDPRATLEALRLEYRARGTGTPREAQAAVHELMQVAERLEPEQIELHAFLLAEELDVIQGGGAGMRELSRRHAEVGPLPLIALGMAERLVRNKSFDVALPLFEHAMRGSLQGLRTRGRVALAAAEAARHAGELDIASSLLDEASKERDLRAEVAKRRLELDPSIAAPTTEIEGAPSDDVLAQDELVVERIDGAPDTPSGGSSRVDPPPGEPSSLAELHRHALAAGNLDHARALEHARACLGSSTAPSPAPPALAGLREDAALVAKLLFGSPRRPVLEALALVWETGLLRNDAPRSGPVGQRRVQPFDGSVLGELYADAARLLASSRTELFHRPSSEPVRAELVLLQRPAMVVHGEARDDSPALRFALGAGLAATMPEHALALARSDDELRVLLDALAAAFGPLAATASDPAIVRLQQNLWQLVTPSAERRLREIFGSGVVMTPEHARQVALQNARRAGLFISGDLTSAIRATIVELELDGAVSPVGADGLASACRAHPALADLVDLATSAAYAQRRWRSDPFTSGDRSADVRW